MASADELSVVSIEERVEDPVTAAAVTAMDAIAWVVDPPDAPLMAAGIHTAEGTSAGASTEEEMEGREGNAGLSLRPSSFTDLSCLEESQFNGSPPRRFVNSDVVLAPTQSEQVILVSHFLCVASLFSSFLFLN